MPFRLCAQLPGFDGVGGQIKKLLSRVQHALPLPRRFAASGGGKENPYPLTSGFGMLEDADPLLLTLGFLPLFVAGNLKGPFKGGFCTLNVTGLQEPASFGQGKLVLPSMQHRRRILGRRGQFLSSGHKQCRRLPETP